MLYKKLMTYLPILCLLFNNLNMHAARVYIKNWSSEPVRINGFISPDADTPTNLILAKKQVIIQPGHSQQITIDDHATSYENFSQFTMTYHVYDHPETETVYFPHPVEQETSFYLTDIGYERFPYNITATSERGV